MVAPCTLACVRVASLCYSAVQFIMGDFKIRFHSTNTLIVLDKSMRNRITDENWTRVDSEPFTIGSQGQTVKFRVNCVKHSPVGNSVTLYILLSIEGTKNITPIDVQLFLFGQELKRPLENNYQEGDFFGNIITINLNHLLTWLHKDGSLRFLCQFNNSIKLKQSAEIEFSFAEEVATKQLEAFRSGKFVDTYLIVGDFKIKCVKFVLCTQSPVFDKMFEAKKYKLTKEGLYVIKVDDFHPAIIDELVQGMYSGSVNITSDRFALDLLSAAMHYEVAIVANQCESYLLYHVNIHNVLDILITGDKYNLDSLLECALSFITPHNLQHIKVRNLRSYDKLDSELRSLLADVVLQRFC